LCRHQFLQGGTNTAAKVLQVVPGKEVENSEYQDLYIVLQ
jgi:hypothetical protein